MCSRTFSDIWALVRGTPDNPILYYNVRTEGFGWSYWSWTGSGSTLDGPAAVECGGKLHTVVRGTGDSLWYGYVDRFDGRFRGWVPLSGSTPSKPDLAAAFSVNTCKLYLVVRGTDSGIYLNVNDGSSWTGWRQLPGSTSDGPAIAILGGTLHIVARGAAPTTTLWHGRMDIATGNWLGWVQLSGSTPSTPDLAADETNGALYLAVRGASDNYVWIRKWTAASGWGAWTPLTDGATSNGPAVTVGWDGKLHLLVVDTNGSSMWYRNMNIATGTWSAWSPMPGSTSATPTLTK